MEILVLGCSGVFLRRVLPALSDLSGITKIHVASKTKTLADIDKTFLTKIGLWFDDYSHAIKSSSAAIVYISLPNHLHFMWAKKSLEAGFNVVLEKPATLELSDTQHLVALSNKKNLCLAESTVWQFHPNVDFLKSKLKLFQDRPLIVNGTFTVPNFHNDNFRNFPEFGGGAFNDMSAYVVSIGRILFDERPYAVSGVIVSCDDLSGIDTAFSIEMKFSRDRIFEGMFGFGLQYKNILNIKGPGLMFQLDRVFSPPSDTEINIKAELDQYPTDQYSKGDPYANFFEAILETSKTTKRSKWSEIMLQDAELTDRLKAVMTLRKE